jgi:hypothetical protein
MRRSGSVKRYGLGIAMMLSALAVCMMASVPR